MSSLRSFQRTTRFKLLTAVVMVMFAVMTLLIFNVTLDAERWSQHQRELRRSWVLQFVKAQLEGQTMVQNTDELREPLTRLMRGDLIQGWAIVDREGVTLEAVGQLDLKEIDPKMAQEARRGLVQASGLYVVAPVIQGSAPINTTVQMKIKVQVKAKLPAIATDVFWLMSLGTLVLLGVLYFMMSVTVLRPLERLARAADSISAGKYDFKLEFSERPDEIGQLLRAFRHMQLRLSNYHEELQREIEASRETIKKQERGLMVAQRLAATGTLAAGIAHEVNNPIGGMLNAAISLKYRHAEDERTVQYLELIIEGLGRVRDTVSKVLQFTPRDVEVGPVDVKKVIDSAVGLAKHRLARGQIELLCEISEGLPFVQGNATELQQVVLNLTLNAIDAIESETGTIRIESGLISGEEKVSMVKIDIRDSGCGMTEDQMAKVFDLFYTTKPPGKGTGLGLSIVHDIVTRHHGKLEIISEAGSGTTVHMRFPATAKVSPD